MAQNVAATGKRGNTIAFDFCCCGCYAVSLLGLWAGKQIGREVQNFEFHIRGFWC